MKRTCVIHGPWSLLCFYTATLFANASAAMFIGEGYVEIALFPCRCI